MMAFKSTMEERDLFSYYIMVPSQPALAELAATRTVIDWRGIPLANPYHFDRLEPGSSVPVIGRFIEKNQYFLKLAHPELGTTTDYSIRSLFNPQENPETVCAFLELGPGCPEAGVTIPVWAVVEVLNKDTLRLLTWQEVHQNWPTIWDTIRHKLGAPPAAIRALFGNFPEWTNPDYGDPGNIHRVCVKCFTQINSSGKCDHCDPQPVTQVDIELNKIPRDVADILGKEFCRKYLLVPITKKGEELTVGMGNPKDIVAMDLVKMQTGLAVQIVPLPVDQIHQWIDQIFPDEDFLADMGSDFDMDDAPASTPETGAVSLPPETTLTDRRIKVEPSADQLLSEPARAIGATKTDSTDVVQCSVFAPAAVSVTQQFMVQVFLHLPSEADLAGRLATEFDASSSRRGFRTLEVQVERGWNVFVELVAPGCEVDEPLQRLNWGGHAESLQYVVRILPGTSPTNVLARVNVTINGIPAGYLKFIIATQEQASGTQNVLANSESLAFKKAFISYASKDRDRVLSRVQLLETLGIHYFQDLLSLSPGDRYADKILQEIDQCDLFLLFWSRAAKDSDWVRKELNHALKRRTENADSLPEIRPIVLEGPPVVEPWPEIADLHLNDRLLYYM